MNILMGYVHWPLAVGQHYAAAFRRAGHTVKTIGPVFKGWINRGTGWHPDYNLGHVDSAGWCKVDMGQIIGILDELPDVIITASGFLRFVGKSDYPQVLISFEPRRYLQECGVEECHWDYVLTAHMDDDRLNGLDCTYLPMGYDPTLHTSRIPWTDRPLLLSYIATMHPDRLELIQHLLKRHWIVAATGLLWPQYIWITNASRSVLHYPNGPEMGISIRVFEALAMGAIIICPPNPAMEAAGLVEGEHYLSYRTTEALHAALQYVGGLEDDSAAGIARTGHEWVKEHTYDARVTTILETLFKQEAVSHAI